MILNITQPRRHLKSRHVGPEGTTKEDKEGEPEVDKTLLTLVHVNMPKSHVRTLHARSRTGESSRLSGRKCLCDKCGGYINCASDQHMYNEGYVVTASTAV